jgi:hypothetical protein
MTDSAMEDMDRTQREREAESEELLERQEHKGYGDDEGEREESFPPQDEDEE